MSAGLVQVLPSAVVQGLLSLDDTQPGDQLALGWIGRLEAAADEAIAVCRGDIRAALKALIVANEFLESEVSELMKAISHAYVRGRFHTYSG